MLFNEGMIVPKLFSVNQHYLGAEMYHGSQVIEDIKLSQTWLCFNSEIEILSVLYKGKYYAAVKITMKQLTKSTQLLLID